MYRFMKVVTVHLGIYLANLVNTYSMLVSSNKLYCEATWIPDYYANTILDPLVASIPVGNTTVIL